LELERRQTDLLTVGELNGIDRLTLDQDVRRFSQMAQHYTAAREQ
jgi:hypothetical protein